METVYLKAKVGATMAKAIRKKCLDCSENRFGCKPATAIAILEKTKIVKLLEE